MVDDTPGKDCNRAATVYGQLRKRLVKLKWPIRSYILTGITSFVSTLVTALSGETGNRTYQSGSSRLACEMLR
jgi:hypothetical protein